MAAISFILVGLGVALIITGSIISIIDWNDKQKKRKKEEIVTEETSLGETLEGLAKLVEALKGHKLGMQLIIIGIVLLLIAGLYGGVVLTFTS